MATGKQKLLVNNFGFTIIELLVVLAIMGLMAGLVLANYAAQRPIRSTAISQSQTVTDIRKVQSYVLSGRTENNVGIRFYALKFTPSTSSYVVMSINDQYAVNLSPATNVSPDVQISHVQIQSGSTITTVACGYVIFAAPFGTTYITSQASNVCSNGSAALATAVADPGSLLQMKDKKMYITFRPPANSSISKTILINGTSGNVIADSTEPQDAP